MQLIFHNPGFSYSVDSILELQREGQSDWWRDSLFAFYPQLNRAAYDALPPHARADYLRRGLLPVYDEQQLARKIEAYDAHWCAHRAQVEAALGDAFGDMAVQRLNDVRANITLNPICPRYLTSTSFDVFYLNSERGALGIALHEIIHFLWFSVWHEHFGDSAEEYETPHLKWVLSEMVVEPIMRDERLRSINPYFEDGCVYAYFYDMKVDRQPILETLDGMYRAAPSMIEFMEQSLAFCHLHEDEIRAQMK